MGRQHVLPLGAFNLTTWDSACCVGIKLPMYTQMDSTRTMPDRAGRPGGQALVPAPGQICHKTFGDLSFPTCKWG